MGSIADNVKRLKERIAVAAERAGRPGDDIVLVAVSKTRTAQEVEEAVRSGISVVGENRVQEAWAKAPQVRVPVRWHMVGHLQTNKVRRALELFELIHSVDSLRLAEAISRHATNAKRQVDVLIQVNTSGEPSKFGASPEAALDLVAAISKLPGIEIKGLMTIGAFLPNPVDVRPCFKQLRDLGEQVKAAAMANVEMKYLSMGMTGDFEVAIEEGSNMVRVGTAIFGIRA